MPIPPGLRRKLGEGKQWPTRTTMIYTHVLNRGGYGVHSPLDRLRKPLSGEEGKIRPARRSA